MLIISENGCDKYKKHINIRMNENNYTGLNHCKLIKEHQHPPTIVFQSSALLKIMQTWQSCSYRINSHIVTNYNICKIFKDDRFIASPSQTIILEIASSHNLISFYPIDDLVQSGLPSAHLLCIIIHNNEIKANVVKGNYDLPIYEIFDFFKNIPYTLVAPVSFINSYRDISIRIDDSYPTLTIVFHINSCNKLTKLMKMWEKYIISYVV